MLRRKILEQLTEWKNRQNHKCLLISGQRQVGKTFIIREFSKSYESSFYIDFNTDSKISKIFDDDLNVDRIINILRISNPEIPIIPKKTLLIFDEIQACPRARSSLKYFTIDGRFDVIASGSLLDVYPKTDDASQSALIPVGYEEHLRMFSLDFEEFLWSAGYTEDLLSDIRNSIRNRLPIDDSVLGIINGHFREFMIVGGMPEAVESYRTEHDMGKVYSILERLNRGILDDASKYTSKDESLKIRKCMESIPLQLAETNKKFMWSRINGNQSRAGARMFSESILWIEGTGMGNLCNSVKELSPPIAVKRNPDQFKVYVSDTGLLINMMGGRTAYEIAVGNPGFNQGAIMENMIAECLMKTGYHPGYYINRKEPGRMELDFVIDLGAETAAIEVKSGKDRSAPSLSKTIGDCRIQRRIMFEWGNISVDDSGIEHYPLFAAAFMKELEKPFEISMQK